MPRAKNKLSFECRVLSMRYEQRAKSKVQSANSREQSAERKVIIVRSLRKPRKNCEVNDLT